MFYLNYQLPVCSPWGPTTLPSRLAFLQKGLRQSPFKPRLVFRTGGRQQTHKNLFAFFSTMCLVNRKHWEAQGRRWLSRKVNAFHQKQNKTQKKRKNTSAQDECMQYVGPYGGIPLASAALHVELCHEQTACNKHLGRNKASVCSSASWSVAKAPTDTDSAALILTFLRLLTIYKSCKWTELVLKCLLSTLHSKHFLWQASFTQSHFHTSTFFSVAEHLL